MHTHTHTNTHTQVRSFAVWRKFKYSTLLLSRNFTRGRSQVRDFAIFIAYRSIHQFPSTIEIYLVYLLSIEFDSWSGVSACFRVVDGNLRLLLVGFAWRVSRKAPLWLATVSGDVRVTRSLQWKVCQSVYFFKFISLMVRRWALSQSDQWQCQRFFASKQRAQKLGVFFYRADFSPSHPLFDPIRSL